MSIRKEAHLFVINECNKNCYHCANSELMQRYNGQLSIKKLETFNLEKFDNLLITGGEPGLLSPFVKKELIYFLTKYNKKITVLTNGTNLQDWPEDINKLVHITDFNKVIIAPKVTYSIVLTSKIDLNQLISCANKLKQIRKLDGFIFIKNDCKAPVPEKQLNLIKRELGLIESNSIEYKNHNLKMEINTNCLFSFETNKEIIHSKINLAKKCSCSFFNCLIE